MSINFVRFLQELDIVNEGVQSFVGERCYMATGDLSNEDTNEFELVTYQNKPSRAALTAKSGDVIFARMKGTNKVLLVTEKESNYIFSTGFVVIRSSENVNKSFLTHFLKSNLFQDEKDKLCTGATQKAINNQNIEKLKFPLPPLATQKRIAEILDAADALRRKDQELLKKYDELAQAIFIDMFGDPVKNEKGWDVKKIQDVCKQIFGGGTPSKSKPEYYLGTIPWVTPKDMKSDIISDSIDHINEDAVKKSSTKLVPKNSVLMVIRSGILKHTLPVAINDKIVSMNQDMKAFIPNTDLTNAIFLKYFFHRVASFLLTKVRAVTADNIEFEQIKNMPFICPPIDLQNDFSGCISNVQKQFETNLELSKKTESLYNTLIQKAFKGELVA